MAPSYTPRDLLSRIRDLSADMPISNMIDNFLEGVDLRLFHSILIWIGFFISAYVMQLTNYVSEDSSDPPWLRWFARLCLVAICLSMLWYVNYSETKNWQPWPPELAIIVSMIGSLLARAVAIHARLIRDGDYWPLQRPFHPRCDVLDCKDRRPNSD